MDLDELTARAIRTVPFYRERYSEGSTFAQLAPISRVDVSGHESDFLSGDVDPASIRLTETSGSTGRPLILSRTESESIRAGVSIWRARRSRASVQPTDNLCRFYGYTRKERSDFGMDPILRSSNLLQFSMFELSDDSMAQYLNELVEFEPAWIQAIPSLLARLAGFAAATGWHPPPSLSLIELTGEALFSADRALIARAFPGVPLADRYAATEVWGIGYECSAGRLHVLTDSVEFELENTIEVADGIEGDVVVTSRHFTTMPLLKYRLRDRVVVANDKCVCGLLTPVIGSLQGRSTDFAIGRSGDPVYPAFFNVAVAQANWTSPGSIVAFHVHETISGIDLLLEVGSAWDHSSEALVKEVLFRKFDPERLSIRVGQVPFVPDGKYQVFSRDPEVRSGQGSREG